ncbi:MAG: outer membrane protein assembly factor BamD [Bacteroidota bacterium]|nr:outer membrane protein assembly factor BamD [Bacteroidota bacterium]
MKFILSTILIVSIIWFLPSCGSSTAIKSISAEERFEIGKQKFDNEDYLEAINEFEIVKLQYPGSAMADDAQYYLAESRVMLEEFFIAGAEFQELLRSMPASPFVPIAQYKIGLCYYKLSPKSSLDQQYTLRAIDEFQTFIEYYPQHDSAAKAAVKIQELNARLAKKLYDTAELYMILEYYKSATVYFTDVVEKYHDTEYAEPALLGKIKSSIARKRYSEARKDIETFIDKYPGSRLQREIEALQKTILYHTNS